MLKQVVYTETTEHQRINLVGNINAINKHRSLLDAGRKVGVDVYKKKNKHMYMFMTNHQNAEQNYELCFKTLTRWQSSHTEGHQQQIKIAVTEKLRADKIQGMLATIQKIRLKHVKL